MSAASVAALAPSAAPALAAAASKPHAAASIELNTATKARLKSLPGIGEAEADRIIAARPLLSKADIVGKAGLPAGTYLAIKRRIFVIPKTLPTARP